MNKSANPRSDRVGRRRFLKGAAVGATALVAQPHLAGAEEGQAPRGAGARPSAQTLAAETQPVPADVQALIEDHPGSDFMVDVLKHLGFEYVAANPGSSFRSLHESIVNYGGNKTPELLTCCHEESSVFMACGYAKAEGKPMAIMAHSTVGLQHASIGIYEAFGAQVPVFIILGNTIDAMTRRPGVEWSHSAQDAAAMVRDYTKWDDLPISLPHFAESAMRAYKRTGRAGGRQPSAGNRYERPRWRSVAYTEAHLDEAARGRRRDGGGTGGAARRRREPCHSRTRRTHTRRHADAG
jgi:hypothetical protein